MVALRWIGGLIAWWICLPAAAVVAEYVDQAPEQPNGTYIELGIPVPQPVTSSLPVAGFRDYASVLSRIEWLALQQDFVTRHELGQSGDGEPIYALQIGKASNVPVMLQSGGMHAREWASPEAVLGIAESLVEHANDGGVVSWLIDQANVVLIPVLNPDGFTTTQRYPTTTRIGEDPQNSSSDPQYPRDGRMRRKNLRDTDGLLETPGDSLLGVDLNRNLNPNWNSGSGSSSNRESIIYHGPAAESESETQALLSASALLGQTHLRLYIDTHTFGRVFFYNDSGNSRLLTISRDLVNLIRQVPPSDYAQSAAGYGQGIGASDEYFSYTLKVPAYTLELEPGTSQLADYGGTPNVSHSGFILPESEISRVREEVFQMALLAFYHQMGPAILEQVVLANSAGTPVYQHSWQAQSNTARAQTTAFNQDLINGERYTLSLIFNKPMRWLNDQQAVTNYPSLNVTLDPQLSLVGASAEELPAGQWTQTRYAADTYTVDFKLPAGLGNSAVLQVAVRDMAGRAVDSNPATIADWNDGHWLRFEDESGQSGDAGGEDRNTKLTIVSNPDTTPAPSNGGGSGTPGLWTLLLLSALVRRSRNLTA